MTWEGGGEKSGGRRTGPLCRAMMLVRRAVEDSQGLGSRWRRRECEAVGEVVGESCEGQAPGEVNVPKHRF